MADFSGNLELDSPNCIKLIKNAFGSAAVEELKSLYLKLFSQSNLLEPATNRPAEIKYNPRPARLTHILINEAECRCFPTIRRAFELSFSENSLLLEKTQPEVGTDLLSAANLLDEIRHLHMHPALNARILESARILSEQVEQNHELHQRLKAMIAKSAQRFSK